MCEFRFMKLYPAELIADTTHLGVSEFGAYVRLLCALWLHKGRLPNDPHALRQIAGFSERHWRRVWPRLVPLFLVTEDGKQIWHKRIDKELNAARRGQNGRDDEAEAAKMPFIQCGIMPASKPHNPLKNNNAAILPRASAREAKNLDSKEKEKEKEMYKDEKKSMVFVAWDTPEWKAWKKTMPKVQPIHSREHRRMGWYFHSQWPDGEDGIDRLAA